MTLRRFASAVAAIVCVSGCEGRGVDRCLELNRSLSEAYTTVMRLHRGDDAARVVGDQPTPAVRRAIVEASTHLANLAGTSDRESIRSALLEYRKLLSFDAGAIDDRELLIRFSETTTKAIDYINLDCAGER